MLQQQVPWQTALGIVFWAGVLFLLVSATPLREAIALAIPAGLRLAAAAGIGLLLTLIGFRNAGLIEADPATLLRLGTLDHRAAFLLVGVLVAVMLQRRNNPLAFLAVDRRSSPPAPGRSATRCRRSASSARRTSRPRF